MREQQLQRLADELMAELNEFLQIKAEIADAQVRIGMRQPDSFELRALGSILHDIYNGVEAICRHIAKEIDRQLPVGDNWHRDLLDQMSSPLAGVRPLIIQPKTAAHLENYRSFRHVVRNIYGYKLDWVLMKPLLEDAPTAIDAFAVDVEQCVAFLRLMASGSGSNTDSLE